MKRLFIMIGCVCLVYVLGINCSNKCILEPVPYGYQLKINLVDKNTGRTLIAMRDTSYFPDSISLEIPGTPQNARLAVLSRDTILISTYIQPGNLFRDTIYFKYRSTKIDTIVVYSHPEEGRACGSGYPIAYTDRLIANGSTVCNPCGNFLERIELRK